MILLVIATIAAFSALTAVAQADTTLLNVSYDPTQEFYAAYDKAFADQWRAITGQEITVEQSHGRSGEQARAVMQGLDADVVTLGSASDINAIRQAGLIAKDWQSRLPNDSCPFTSTVVFLIRGGNPKGIRDWSDIARPGVSVVTPDPKASSGGRWNFLAAWGWALDHWNGDASKAREFMTKIYKDQPVHDTGARDATNDFTRRSIGDVLLTWENEAKTAMQESGPGQFEIVYPSESIVVKPPIAVVDRTVDARGTRGAAQSYLKYLYSDAGQELAAKYFYRPQLKSVAARHAGEFPPLKLFTVADKFESWDAAQAKYFNDGGVLDQIYKSRIRQR